MGENLRIYSQQLTVQLREKEKEFTDLQRKFSKLQGRFSQLDYAFKQNLELHQQQMIEMHVLHVSQNELRKVHEDRWKQFCQLEDQLTQVTDEKEAAKNCLVYWKQAAIDQKKFYERKYKERVRELKLKIEAAAVVHQKTIKETESLAEKRIQQLVDGWKQDKEKAEVTRKKAIMLQGDVDVLSHRTRELACLIENFSLTHENSQAIRSCIVKVLRSLSNPSNDYDKIMNELNEKFIQQIPQPRLTPEECSSDYETLKSQNLVLREVVKKLKNQLTTFQKSKVMESNPAVENSLVTNLREELIQSNSKNKNLRNLLSEKNAELRQLEMKSKQNISRLEMSLESMKSLENEERMIFTKTNSNSSNCITSKAVQTEKEFVSYFVNRESGDIDDDTNEEAYWGLQGGRVKKFREQATRDMKKSFELNSEPQNSGRGSGMNDGTLKDKQKAESNNGSYVNAEKKTYSLFNRGPFEPIISHLNSVQYNEYTISFSKDQNLKIRHPIARGYPGKIFQFHAVYSQEEYQSMPIEEAVLYFEFANCDTVFLKSKVANCGVQTLPISSENVFTQTTLSKDTSNSQTSSGVKILNSERRAIERSLRDLEKTVSQVGEETLWNARSVIINTRKFPPSEEFFDCVRYLSQCGST